MAVFDELLVKIARAESLNPLELEEFRREAKGLSDLKNVVSSWLQPGSNIPKFQSFVCANSPDWQQSPLHSYTFSRLADVTVANDTDTYITFDYSVGESKFFKLDESDMSKLRILRGGSAWQLLGYITWAPNATGYRYIKVEGFTHADLSLGDATLYTAAGHSAGINNVTPINYASSWQQFANLAYLKFFVRQTSGGSLDIPDIVLNIHLM